MKLTKYGVTLNLLTEDKIEMIRIWRNDPKIVQYMEYRGYITPEMQEKWFNSINNENNYYFIFEFKGKEIGLINVRDIDSQLKIGEAGIYIYDDEWLNSTISFQASMCLYDFCFEILKLTRINAHILKDNKRAIKFNKLMGYEISGDEEDNLNQLYILSHENYLTKRNDILSIINY